MSLNLKMLGTNIQSKRKAKNLNQEELAFRVGISRNYMSMIENGKKEVSITFLVEIAENLGCTVNDFLIGSQTYDAFLPLIAVALIYLAVVMILEKLLACLEKRLKKNE